MINCAYYQLSYFSVKNIDVSNQAPRSAFETLTQTKKRLCLQAVCLRERLQPRLSKVSDLIGLTTREQSHFINQGRQSSCLEGEKEGHSKRQESKNQSQTRLKVTEPKVNQVTLP